MPLPRLFSPSTPPKSASVSPSTSSQSSGGSGTSSPMSVTPTALTPTDLNAPGSIITPTSIPTGYPIAVISPTQVTPTSPTAVTPTNQMPLGPFGASPNSPQTTQALNNLSSLTLSPMSTSASSVPFSPLLSSIPIHHLPSIAALSPQSVLANLHPTTTPITNLPAYNIQSTNTQSSQNTQSHTVNAGKQSSLTPTATQEPDSPDIDPNARYDPMASPDWDRAGTPGHLCSGRVKTDLRSIFHEPLPGIFAIPEEENMFKVHCLIIGPFDTPYEGGFFHFLVRFGPQYPLHPPRVRLMTTGSGTVRFNPNLYRNGKVCLSILGTWPGPAWSPALNLSSVLLSLQSLMNERPYHNEPGYDEERNIGDSGRYNQIIEHETIRVSVLQQLESRACLPSELFKVMEESFMEYYDHYIEVCQKNIHKDGTAMNDPFGEVRGCFRYAAILKQLQRLKAKLKASGVKEVTDNSELENNNIGEPENDASSISGSEESIVRDNINLDDTNESEEVSISSISGSEDGTPENFEE